MWRYRRSVGMLVCLVILVGWIGCGSSGAPATPTTTKVTAPAAAPQRVDLAGLQPVEGWKANEIERYTAENLFAYMNGEAELYFTYHFQSLSVQQFEAAGKPPLAVELYQVAAPEDAYGLYTYYRTGAPVAVGNGGDLDTGYRLAFWQNQFYARVFSLEEAIDDETLQSFATRLAALLPAGGEPPTWIAKLSGQGLQAESVKFFHDKMILDSVLWLGSENILKLDPETDAVAAEYQRSGATLQLLVVQYGNEAAAQSALQSVQQANVAEVAATQQAGHYLVVVVGDKGVAATGLAGEAAQALR